MEFELNLGPPNPTACALQTISQSLPSIHQHKEYIYNKKKIEDSLKLEDMF